MLTLQQYKEQNPAYKNVSDTELFNHFHDNYYSDVPKDQFAKEVGYEFPDKPFTNDALEVGKAVVRGTLGGLNESVGNAIQAYTDEGSALNDYGKFSSEYGRQYQDNHPADMEGRGLLAESLIKAGEVAPLSAVSIAPAFVPGIGPALSALTTVSLFGGDQYKRTHDTVLDATGDPDAAHRAGLEAGAIEGGFELVANQLGALPFLKVAKGLFGKMAATEMGSVISNETTQGIVKPFVKSLATTTAIENSTELAQGFGEAAVEDYHLAGDNISPEERAKDIIKTTSGLVAFLSPFGLHAQIKSSKAAKDIDNTLNDPQIGTPEYRQQVVDYLHTQAVNSGVPQSEADAWKVGATNDVSQGLPIRRSAGTNVSDVLQANSVDDAITAAQGAVEPEGTPQQKADAEAQVRAQTHPGIGLLQSIDARYQPTGYVPFGDQEVTPPAELQPPTGLLGSQSGNISQEPTPQAFKPTHELSDGTPVQHLEGNTYLDSQGNETQDDYATPIQQPVTQSATVDNAKRDEYVKNNWFDKTLNPTGQELPPPPEVKSPEQTIQAPATVPAVKAAKLATIVPTDGLLTAIAKLGGLNAEEAQKQGIDKAYMNKRGYKISRVFTKSKSKTFDEMAETLRQYGYDVKDPNHLLRLVSESLNQGKETFTPQGHEHIAQLMHNEKFDEEQANLANELDNKIQIGDLSQEHLDAAIEHFDENFDDGQTFTGEEATKHLEDFLGITNDQTTTDTGIEVPKEQTQEVVSAPDYWYGLNYDERQSLLNKLGKNYVPANYHFMGWDALSENLKAKIANEIGAPLEKPKSKPITPQIVPVKEVGAKQENTQPTLSVETTPNSESELNKKEPLKEVNWGAFELAMHPVNTEERRSFEKASGVKLPGSYNETIKALKEWKKDQKKLPVKERLNISDFYNEETKTMGGARVLQLSPDKQETNPLSGIPKAFIADMKLSVNTPDGKTDVSAAQLLEHYQQQQTDYENFIKCLRG